MAGQKANRIPIILDGYSRGGHSIVPRPADKERRLRFYMVAFAKAAVLGKDRVPGSGCSGPT